MAKNTSRMTIRNMPLVGGLATAGQQGVIDEGQLWRATNMIGGFDGLLQKRPGIRKWGQTIKQPAEPVSGTDDRASIYSDFLDMGEFSITESDSTAASYNVQHGRLSPYTLAGAGEYVTFGRNISPTEVPVREKWSVRLTMRAYNMEDLSAEANGDGGHVEIVGQALGTAGAKSFALFMDGIYYYNGATWVQLLESFIGDAGFHTIEIQCDPDANTTVYVDDADTGGTVASSSVSANTALTNSDIIDLIFHSGVGQSSYDVMDYQYKDDTDTPFVGTEIKAIAGFRKLASGGNVDRFLLIATDSHVYVDIGLNLSWSPITNLQGNEPAFTNYRGTIIIFDATATNSRMLQWDGVAVPELLDDAPPCKFGTEHHTRLIASGDPNFPERVYYSASRQPNVWFAPEVDPDETFDETVNAGYIELTTSQGIAACTATLGEYDGTAIFTTDDTLWQLVGVGPQSYRMIKLERNSGAAGSQCITQVNRSAWMLGRDGISSFPEVAEGAPKPSAAIQDLWTMAPSLPHQIDLIQIHKSVIAHDSGTNNVLIGIPELGEDNVSTIYAYNTQLMQWYGPWESDSITFASVEVADPVLRTIALGTHDGNVGILMPAIRQDYGTDNYTATFVSPYLSGRSLDPQLTQYTKTWKKLRLYIHPHGNWNINVTWQTDGDKQRSGSEIQNKNKSATLGYSWRLTDDIDGRINSEQRIVILDFTLDARGSWLKFSAATADDNDGEMFSLLGYEVDFTVDQYEQE